MDSPSVKSNSGLSYSTRGGLGPYCPRPLKPTGTIRGLI